MNSWPLPEMVLAVLLVPFLCWPLLGVLCQPAGSADGASAPKAPLTPSETLTLRLHHQLLGLSVGAYERLIAELLQAAGYQDVRILRNHRAQRRSHKGRNRHGGIDLSAILRTELSTTAILVQVKQYQRPVSRRFVDELRGALLRTGARQGLLITTGTFALTARRAASQDHIGPIQLIDGLQLQELLLRHRLGLQQTRTGRWRMDRRFFRHLEGEVA